MLHRIQTSQAILAQSSPETKGHENPEFCASVTCGSFPYNPVAGSGTFGNCPVGPEILIFHAKGAGRFLLQGIFFLETFFIYPFC